jgi:hypothetical protein
MKGAAQGVARITSVLPSRVKRLLYGFHKKGQIMRKFTNWMAAILLLATPQLTVAQHGGHGTGGMSGTPMTPTLT